MTCEEVRLSLGAHALGALEPDEALEIDMHLATCEVCGAELMELAGVTAFLGKVTERDIDLVSSPPKEVLDRLLNARVKRTRRSRVLLAVAASAAAIAVGGTTWGVVQHDNAQKAQISSAQAQQDRVGAAPTPAPYNAEVAPPQAKSVPGRAFVAENEDMGYYATVVAFPERKGTSFDVAVQGIPPGTTCRLVVYGKNGQRDTTEPWTVSRQTYTNKTVFRRESRLPMDSIKRFAIVDTHGNTLVKIERT
ncbi:anti-sigma factor family protein [Nonomuraea sediminis]|uniref:anti-sigma factor family protein n=1 Tax=Nonomuraea sediminis TaxID=2835864 RepID=UPI001BDC77A7|nr:zf-HC2 domain-containing protein [Nonomuraea sediminis]